MCVRTLRPFDRAVVAVALMIAEHIVTYVITYKWYVFYIVFKEIIRGRYFLLSFTCFAGYPLKHQLVLC